jgi:hypothetical protein
LLFFHPRQRRFPSAHPPLVDVFESLKERTLPQGVIRHARDEVRPLDGLVDPLQLCRPVGPLHAGELRLSEPPQQSGQHLDVGRFAGALHHRLSHPNDGREGLALAAVHLRPGDRLAGGLS